MKGLISVCLFALVTLVRSTATTECADACNQAYPTGLEVTFCGTDYQTYTAPHDAINSHCYFNNCNITAVYAGKCGCPNECFATFQQGQCQADGKQCQCDAAWRGEDCSIPNIGNTCSLHGKLATVNGDYACQCDEGFTGIDCSSPNFNLGSAPWGNIYGGKEYHGDTYGDDHPIFNQSVIARIYVTVAEADLLSELYTWSTYDTDYVSANVSFDNGHIQQHFTNIGFRTKGAFSRMDMKKGWYLKFNEYDKGQDFYEIKKLGLKPGSNNNDIMTTNMIYTNFQRAAEIPVQRASFALLYVNEFFYGFYFMHEDVDEAFIQNYYANDDGQGNMYKMCHDFNLLYLGDDVQTYQNLTGTYPNGEEHNSIEMASSLSNDWTDLVDFLRFVNTSSDSDFFNGIDSHIDIAMLLKGLVVESFMLGGDGFVKGQNFYFYHQHDGSKTSKQFSNFNNDFDEALENSGIGQFHENTNIFDFIIRQPGSKDYNPLVTRLLSSSKYLDMYVTYYQEFLETIFGSKSAQQPSKRYSTMFQFTMPWMARDQLWRVSQGETISTLTYNAENTTANLNVRYQDTYKQIQAYWDNSRKQ